MESPDINIRSLTPFALFKIGKGKMVISAEDVNLFKATIAEGPANLYQLATSKDGFEVTLNIVSTGGDITQVGSKIAGSAIGAGPALLGKAKAVSRAAGRVGGVTTVVSSVKTTYDALNESFEYKRTLFAAHRYVAQTRANYENASSEFEKARIAFARCLELEMR